MSNIALVIVIGKCTEMYQLRLQDLRHSSFATLSCDIIRLRNHFGVIYIIIPCPSDPLAAQGSHNVKQVIVITDINVSHSLTTNLVTREDQITTASCCKPFEICHHCAVFSKCLQAAVPTKCLAEYRARSECPHDVLLVRIRAQWVPLLEIC